MLPGVMVIAADGQVDHPWMMEQALATNAGEVSPLFLSKFYPPIIYPLSSNPPLLYPSMLHPLMVSGGALFVMSEVLLDLVLQSGTASLMIKPSHPVQKIGPYRSPMPRDLW